MLADPTKRDARWLLTLRWAAILGQLITLWVATRFFGLNNAKLPLYSIIAAEALLNIYPHWRQAKSGGISPKALGALFFTDATALTALLYFSGGPHNPFNFVYLVNIVLAAVVLGRRWSAALAIYSSLAFGLLFLWHEPMVFMAIQDPHAHHDGGHTQNMAMEMHLQGMWVAFTVSAAFLVYFVGRITQELQRREEELRAAQTAALRLEKLSALGTLAAGAAHELATPLSSIAVIANELEYRLQDPATAELHDDVSLIRQEVERCRNVLDQLAVDAGASGGASHEVIDIDSFVREVVDACRSPQTIRVQEAAADAKMTFCAPKRPVAQALKALLNNAVDASDGKDVLLQVICDNESIGFEVKDDGHGMPPEVLERATEPFFTTKAPGKGMGLGLHLCYAIATGLGGDLRLHSQEQTGTTAILTIPQGKSV